MKKSTTVNFICYAITIIVAITLAEAFFSINILLSMLFLAMAIIIGEVMVEEKWDSIISLYRKIRERF